MEKDDLWAENEGAYLGFGVSPEEPDDLRPILEENWELGTPQMNRYPNPDDANYSGDRHLITVGPNGSGKSRRVLIPNLFRLTNWSAVVVDIKGELAAYTAAHRAAQPGHEVVVIDPFGVMQRNYPRLVKKYPFLVSRGFNPLSVLDPGNDEFPDFATALAEAMIRADSRDPHWGQSAQDLVAALIMYIKLRMPKTGSLADVRAILGKRAMKFRRSLVALGHTAIRRDYDELTIKAGRFQELTDGNRELNSIISSALTQTRWLDSRPIKADLAKGNFDFSVLKKSATTVYLILPPRYLSTHSTWLRVLVTSILLQLLRSVDDAQVPVLFMLDEFAQLGQMHVIESNLALMRGYGIKLWLVLQDLAQLKALYQDRWESFIGNAGVLHSFAPQDAMTREYLSKLSAQRLYWVTTQGSSASTNVGEKLQQTKGTSQGLQYFQGPSHWPHGLGLMDTGQAVLFSRGHAVRSWFPDPEDKNDLLKLKGDMQKARNQFL